MADATPYFSDSQVTLWHGDSLAILKTLPDASVDCCVTSPPYFGLRDYGETAQYGLESSPAEYVETMRAVFAEVRRVLADDGTLWLNLGDSYYSGRGNHGGYDPKQPARRGFTKVRALDKGGAEWAKPKSLLGIPWRVAFALQDDGWILRNDVIWVKSNPMPESVADRLQGRHEHVFMFAKERRYWFDLNPIREPSTEREPRPIGGRNLTPRHQVATDNTGWKDHPVANHEAGKNPGDVWMLPTQPFTDAHFAVMPQALAERAILAGCKAGGTVLDPFSGSGTTGLAANKHGRKYVGIDLNADYLDLSLRTRFAQPGLDLSGEASA